MTKIIYPSIPAIKTFPMVRLGHMPTPLEEMPNLSAKYPGTNLWIKRDDCTGLGMGGNKVRQLEFYLGDALSQGCDTVLSTGAVQSNYMRTLAAAASKLGLECHIQLEDRVRGKPAEYHKSGNKLLTEVFGATIYHYGEGEDEHGADNELAKIAKGLQAKGSKTYIVPLAPVPKPKGALGYIDAAYELIEQCGQQGLQPDLVIVGSGSGYTHAGLLFGMRLQGNCIPVIGACVRRHADLQFDRIRTHCDNLSTMLDTDLKVVDSDIMTDDRAFLPGYGQMSDAVRLAIHQAATMEGLLVDPIYTGKSLSCLLQGLEAGAFGEYKNIVFWHTGGAPAIFAYQSEFTA